MNNQNIKTCLHNIANELHALITLLGEPNEPVPAQASPAERKIMQINFKVRSGESVGHVISAATAIQGVKRVRQPFPADSDPELARCCVADVEDRHTYSVIQGLLDLGTVESIEINAPRTTQVSPAAPSSATAAITPTQEPIQTSELVEKLRRDYQYTHNWAETAHKFGLKKAEAVRLAHTAPPTTVLYPGMAPDRIYNVLKVSRKPMTIRQLIAALEANGGAPKPGTLSAAVNSLRYQGRLKSVKLPRRKGTWGRPPVGYAAV